MSRRKPSTSGVPVILSEHQLERIAAQIRANPAAAPGLTAALSLEQHIALAHLIDAAAEAEQDAKEQREIAERRASYRRRPSRRRAPQHSTWPYWLWLLLTAVALYYAKGPILVIATIIGVAILWVKFAQRFPLTAVAILGFMRGLTGRR